MPPRLKRMYGYFRCECGHYWESSSVYCIKGTKKVYYSQMCSACKIAKNPYKVEYLKCRYCWETTCICTYTDKRGRKRNKRNIDPKKAHLGHLCMKCLRGFPCGRDESNDDDDDDGSYYRDSYDNDDDGSYYRDSYGNDDDGCCYRDSSDNDDDRSYYRNIRRRR